MTLSDYSITKEKLFIDHSFTKIIPVLNVLSHFRAKKTLNAKTSKSAIIRYPSYRHLRKDEDIIWIRLG
jgi:hypothetical protein